MITTESVITFILVFLVELFGFQLFLGLASWLHHKGYTSTAITFLVDNRDPLHTCKVGLFIFMVMLTLACASAEYYPFQY